MFRPLIWPADETEDQKRLRYLEDRVNFLEQNARVRLGNSDAVLMDDLGNVEIDDNSDNHNITGPRHTVVGSRYDLVGLPSAANTLGLTTPVTNVGANQVPIGGTDGAITWNGVHRFMNQVGIGDDPTIPNAVLSVQHPTILDTVILQGINVDIEHTASTTPAEVTGVAIFVSRNSGSGIPLEITGLEVRVNHSAILGTLPTLTHIKITGFVNSSTITTTYGIYIDDISGGTQTNAPWSIYAADVNAPSYFAGDVLTGTSTAVAGAQVVVAGGNISVASGNFIDALTDGLTGGFRAGSATDVLLYRGGADTWITPDSFEIDGTLGVGSSPSTIAAINFQITGSSVSNLYGLLGLVFVNGTTATAIGWESALELDDGVAVTNAYLIHVPSVTLGVGATLTNAYGLKIENITAGGTLNYAIYTGTGLVRFGDDVSVAADNFIDVLTNGTTGGFRAGTASDVLWYRFGADVWGTPDGISVGGLATFSLGATVVSGYFFNAITDGSTGGFRAGVLSDVVWYRSAADQWRTPDDVIVGPGGTGTAVVNLALDSGNGAGSRPAVIFQRNSVTKGLFGLAGAANDIVTGSAVEDFIIRNVQLIGFSANGGTTLHMAIQNDGKVKVGSKSFVDTTVEKTVTTSFTTIYTIPAASSAGVIFVNGTDASSGTASVVYMAVVYWCKSSDTVASAIEEKVGAGTASLQFSGDDLQIRDDGGGFFNTCKVISIWSQNG